MRQSLCWYKRIIFVKLRYLDKPKYTYFLYFEKVGIQYPTKVFILM